MKLILYLFAALLFMLTPLHAVPPVVGGLERAETVKFAGAVLVSELGCASCHASVRAEFAAKAGPDLSAVLNFRTTATLQ